MEVAARLEMELDEAEVGITLEPLSTVEEVPSVVTAIVLGSTGVAVVSAEVRLGVVCTSGCVIAIVVVTGTRPPVSGDTA